MSADGGFSQLFGGGAGIVTGVVSIAKYYGDKWSDPWRPPKWLSPFITQSASRLVQSRTAGRTPADTGVRYNAPPVILYPPAPGRDTTAARRRRGGGPGYRPSWWRTRPGWEAYRDCLRRGYDEIECREYLEQAFVGPIPAPVRRAPPTRVPSPDVAVRRTATRVAVGRIIGRLLGPLPYIFWPSRTADDDTVPGPMPQTAPQRTRGPQRRPVIAPSAPTTPTYYPQQPKFPEEFEPEPDPTPVSSPEPYQKPLPKRPKPGRWPAPGTRPATRPGTRPGTRPTPTPRTPAWPDLLPYLLPYMQPQPKPKPTSRPAFRTRPLTPGQTQPLQYPQPLPLQARPANCPPCERETKKRKKRKCTNPITSRRTYSRDGQRFRTITRKLQCQA